MGAAATGGIFDLAGGGRGEGEGRGAHGGVVVCPEFTAARLQSLFDKTDARYRVARWGVCAERAGAHHGGGVLNVHHLQVVLPTWRARAASAAR